MCHNSIQSIDQKRVADLVGEMCQKVAPKFGCLPEEVLGCVFERVLRLIAKQLLIRCLDNYVRRCCRHEIRRACRNERSWQGANYDGDGWAVESVPAPSLEPQDEACGREQEERLQRCRSLLTEKEWEVLEVFFRATGKDGAMKQLAAARGCSRQVLYREKKRALACLGRALGIRMEKTR